MDQADRDALIACRGDLVDQGFDLGPVQCNQHSAGGIHAFGHRETALAGQQRFGQLKVQVVLLKPAFGAHFDDIAKAVGGNQGRLGTTPFDQRIGGQCRAVNDLAHVAGCHASFGADLMHAINDRVFGRDVGCQNLG